MLAAIDWTTVLVVGVPAYIAAVAAPLAALYGARLKRDVKTPSGDTLGAVAERTHDITHASNVLLRQMNGAPHADG